MRIKRILLTLLLCLTVASAFSQPDFWQKSWILMQLKSAENARGIVPNLNKYDWNVRKRQQLEQDANQYLENIESKNTILYAPELSDYLHRRLLKIYPKPFWPIHFSEINDVIVVVSSVPDIQLLNNGKILITTGMICLASNEDELTALIAQQVSNLILDVNFEAYRSGRTTENAAVLMGAGAQVATTVAMDRKNDDYYWNSVVGELAGDATMIIAGSIFNSMSSRADLNRKMRADTLTKRFLIQFNTDDRAIGRIMNKIWNYSKQHPEYENFGVLASSEKYEKRLKNLEYKADATTIDSVDRAYIRATSAAIEQNVMQLMKKQKYDEASLLLDKIINQGVAVEDDYVMKAVILRYKNDSQTNDNEILRLLELAESRPNTNSENIDIERALAYIRLGRTAEALGSLEKARDKVEHYTNPSEEQLSWINKTIARYRIQ
jgi:hypothetical protein